MKNKLCVTNLRHLYTHTALTTIHRCVFLSKDKIKITVTLFFPLFCLTNKYCRRCKMKLHCCTSRPSHSLPYLPANAKIIILYKMYCYRRGESEISTGSAWHSFLAGSLRLSFLYFVTFYKSKMKQSPWHLTLMFLHRKTAFYSDISSPFNNLHVVVQNTSHSKVQSILPLIQIFFHGFGLNTSAKRQCQLIGLHFRTFRGYISLLEWEDTPCFSSLYGLIEMRWSWPWTLPQCSADNSLTSFFNKKENVLVLPAVVSGTPDTKKQWLEITSITDDHYWNIWHYHISSLLLAAFSAGYIIT